MEITSGHMKILSYIVFNYRKAAFFLDGLKMEVCHISWDRGSIFFFQRMFCGSLYLSLSISLCYLLMALDSVIKAETTVFWNSS
uniref:Putative ovule protein n=1 Tax=Solanum chacoense TaxID=4108 RepID=A0A0V0HDA5_SOLCH